MANSRWRMRVVLYMDTILSSVILLRALLQIGQWIVNNAVAKGNNVDINSSNNSCVWEPWMISITVFCLVAKVVIPLDLLRATETNAYSAHVLQAARKYRNSNVADFIVMFSVTPFILLGTQDYWRFIVSPSWLVPVVWLVIGLGRIVCGLAVCSFIEDVKAGQLFSGPPSYAKVVEEQMV